MDDREHTQARDKKTAPSGQSTIFTHAKRKTSFVIWLARPKSPLTISQPAILFRGNDLILHASIRFDKHHSHLNDRTAQPVELLIKNFAL